LYARDLTPGKLRAIRALLRRREPEERVFFCPGAVELYLDEPDMSFQFSAYRSWHDSERTIAIPHPWTPVWPEVSRTALEWQGKPPCKIGFMGTTYRDSRAARSVAGLPAALRRYALRGRHLRSPSRLAWLNRAKMRVHFMPAFARFKTLDAVTEAATVCGAADCLEFIDTGGFDGSKFRKQAFADHLMNMTYVLCPRGHENYSFRAYEALRFGRVPVIVDTDMVLPGMIDWEKVAIIVPGDRPEQVFPAILEDYNSRSADAFTERQAQAFAASDRLDGEEWLADAIREAIARVERRRAAA
jgi:hypothetical protein